MKNINFFFLLRNVYMRLLIDYSLELTSDEKKNYLLINYCNFNIKFQKPKRLPFLRVPNPLM